jgi:hypothetical protein
MSLASAYNALEKKYRVVREGPFTALVNVLGEAIVKMDAPKVKKQTSAEKLVAAYEGRINEALAIEDVEKKYQALNEIKTNLEKHREKNRSRLEKLSDTAIKVIAAVGAAVTILPIVVILSPSVFVFSAASVAFICTGAAGGLAIALNGFKLSKWVRKEIGAKILDENAGLESSLNKVSQEMAAVGTMPDGSIYAGISPDTKKPMYVTVEDAGLTMHFNTAVEYAQNLDAHGHKDWRLPTQAELNVLFENREKGALKGTFNSISLAECYWNVTNSHNSPNSRSQSFKDGSQLYPPKLNTLSVRCVRCDG